MHVDLQGRLKMLESRSVKLRIGVVTTTAPLAVELGGADAAYTGCKRLASYTPTAADTVAVLLAGNTLLILGKIV